MCNPLIHHTRHRHFRRRRHNLAPAQFPALPAVEAGSVWREEKLRDFVFRLRCLGLDGDPAFAELAARIVEETQAIEEMAVQQRSPGYQQPWWADGEYDAARADR